MRILVVPVVLLGTLSAPAGARDYARVVEALDAGRFLEAEAAVAGEADPGLRELGRVEILYRARDYPGALAAAEAALERDPGEPTLLQRAASASLQLNRPAETRLFVERLEAVLEARIADVGHRELWREMTRDFLRRCAEMAEAEGARERAVSLARGLSLGLLAALLLFAGALARSLGRASSPSVAAESGPGG